MIFFCEHFVSFWICRLLVPAAGKALTKRTTCQINTDSQPIMGLDRVYLHVKVLNRLFNTYDAAGASRRQVQNVTMFQKCQPFLNLITIFGITMENAFKRVQTCLVSVHYFVKKPIKCQKCEKVNILFGSVKPMLAF